MSKNYIERISSENGINIKIHKDGKVCTLTNPNNIKLLLNICHKNNRYFKKSNTIENADDIIKEFELYRSMRNKKNQKLKIMPDIKEKLTQKIKLVRRIPTRGKIFLSASLATTIGLTTIGIINHNNKVNAQTYYTPRPTIEEDTEYISGLEDIEMSAPSVVINNDTNDYIINYDDDFIIEPEETLINNDDEIKVNNNEINQMLQINEFNFSHKDRTNEENVRNAKRYEDLFIKYGTMYGVDPNLLIAMACQENEGKHYEALNIGSATGIMQIERKPNLNTTVKAYNFETGEIDKVKITQDAIEDLETNIQIGTIIIRNKLEEFNYNVPLALQAYNFGSGNISKVINSCSESTGLSKSDIKNDPSVWLNYRNVVHVGDPHYIENVFSYVKSGTVLTIKDRDGNDLPIRIINDEAVSVKMA